MKKYVKPVMDGQLFISDEYVAVCGNQTSYSFECDAGKGEGKYGGNKIGYLYLSDWTPSMCYRKNYRGEYVETDYDFQACGNTHESNTDDVYVLGWFDTDTTPNNGVGERQVYIWQEIKDGYVVDHHATTKIKDIVSQINRS